VSARRPSLVSREHVDTATTECRIRPQCRTSPFLKPHFSADVRSTERPTSGEVTDVCKRTPGRHRGARALGELASRLGPPHGLRTALLGSSEFRASRAGVACGCPSRIASTSEAPGRGRAGAPRCPHGDRPIHRFGAGPFGRSPYTVRSSGTSSGHPLRNPLAAPYPSFLVRGLGRCRKPSHGYRQNRDVALGEDPSARAQACAGTAVRRVSRATSTPPTKATGKTTSAANGIMHSSVAGNPRPSARPRRRRIAACRCRRSIPRR
jgi:hypothetical protein